MEIFRGIVLQTIEFLTLTFGILGMTISLMLLFSPRRTQRLSDLLNRSIDIEKRIKYVDKEVEITDFFYDHHVTLGILLVAGSAFSLFFFFFSLDILRFAAIICESQANIFIIEAIVSTITSIGKIGCMAGLVFGLMLVFKPDLLKRIENKMNLWITAKPFFDKLDKSNHGMDTFFFSHPVAGGLTGAVMSFMLIALSLINLLK